ncbi:MAG: glycosyl hydrolase [Bacteroidetes bacterium]|nr:glycosyl hydrolase [Bacteroidota bacterium]
MNYLSLLLVSAAVVGFTPLQAQKKGGAPVAAATEKPKEAHLDPASYSALNFRSIGPAVTSGRIGDIAVHPYDKSIWYIVAASGGVWKTVNAGVTFEPVFDGEGSYSIGCVALDPQNPNVVWIGSGENNNQRSVGYGDGLYKSEDGGKSWKNVGLKTSEHIGRIAIDPTNSDVVFVAAYGPLWSAGGERGIYKTIDGGKTWKAVLTVSENTGFNDVLIDPKHPNIVYAAAHQRRRHEWTYVGGGPETAVYRSTDGGANWDKLTNGLPKGDVGRIGLAISPVNTDMVYAIVEARDGKGVYRSTDRGASWEKRGGYSTSGNYYQEIVCDPVNPDRVYAMDVWIQVSNDGGKTFSGLGERNKHVDNHALWIDPLNTNHMLAGCDGGLYETFDAAANWHYKANLPITQFYHVTVDNALPFYNVYGGTQDNNTLGGPSRTVSATGIINSDWFVTVGGDGFKSVVDPTDPNIVYSQWQYGGLVRYDRRTGEQIDIKPQEPAGAAAYRWNWDAPILISHFDNKRVYFAANVVFRSNDRGNSWNAVSSDLSRGIDRNKLPVMGKVWGMDAVAKNGSTSIYGNVTALSESWKNENLLVAGTDDGLIQITTDGGKNWRKVETVAGVPNQTLVQNVLASRHDENVIYAVFNNHRSGDFKPYLMKSSDKGNTWTNIGSTLPERGSVYCITEDSKNPNLIFAGTEFGMHFSADGGKNWVQLNGGLPTVAVREIAIQERENDLVIATFGRGFYILDDYSPLQNITPETFKQTAAVLPVRDGLAFIQSTPFGHKGKSFQGASLYNTETPGPGATITWYLKDDYKTLKEIRKAKEKELVKNNKPVPYPSADSIRLEDQEEAPYILMVIADEQGNIVRRMKQSAKKGLHRTTWNGRIERTSPVSFYTPDPDNPYESEDVGPLALPGRYQTYLVKVVNGVSEQITQPVFFNLRTLLTPTLAVDAAKLADFNKRLADFRRVALGTEAYMQDQRSRIKFLKQAVLQTPNASPELLKQIREAENMLTALNIAFNGDQSMAGREFETLPGLTGVIENIVFNLWATSGQQTGTYEQKLADAKTQFAPLYAQVKQADEKLAAIEKQLENSKAPYTPGRLPVWDGK